MLVSHRHQFIYTKTVKTAGTSIEKFFEPACRADGSARMGALSEELISDAGIVGYCGSNRKGKKWFDHMPAKAIKSYLGDEAWESYFKFCVIRNPFDKLVSAFHFYEWLVNHYSGWQKTKLVVAHGIRPGSKLDEVKRFQKWVAWTWWFNDYDKYLINGNVCVDFFIRYESLLSDTKSVCENVNFPFEPNRIPKLNTAMRPRERELAEYYDAKTIATVRKRFQFELDYFGYELHS